MTGIEILRIQINRSDITLPQLLYF